VIGNATVGCALLKENERDPEHSAGPPALIDTVPEPPDAVKVVVTLRVSVPDGRVLRFNDPEIV
jgi:hypothetical protein